MAYNKATGLWLPAAPSSTPTPLQHSGIGSGLCAPVAPRSTATPFQQSCLGSGLQAPSAPRTTPAPLHQSGIGFGLRNIQVPATATSQFRENSMVPPAASMPTRQGPVAPPATPASAARKLVHFLPTPDTEQNAPVAVMMSASAGFRLTPGPAVGTVMNSIKLTSGPAMTRSTAGFRPAPTLPQRGAVGTLGNPINLQSGATGTLSNAIKLPAVGATPRTLSFDTPQTALSQLATTALATSSSFKAPLRPSTPTRTTRSGVSAFRGPSLTPPPPVRTSAPPNSTPAPTPRHPAPIKRCPSPILPLSSPLSSPPPPIRHRPKPKPQPTPRIKSPTAPPALRQRIRKNRLLPFTPTQEAWLLTHVSTAPVTATGRKNWLELTKKFNETFGKEGGERTARGLSMKYTHLKGAIPGVRGISMRDRWRWRDSEMGGWLVCFIEGRWLKEEGGLRDRTRRIDWGVVNEEFKKVWLVEVGEAGLFAKFVRLWEPPEGDGEEEREREGEAEGEVVMPGGSANEAL